MLSCRNIPIIPVSISYSVKENPFSLSSPPHLLLQDVETSGAFPSTFLQDKHQHQILYSEVPLQAFALYWEPSFALGLWEVLLLSPHDSKSPSVLCPISPSRHRAFSEQQLHHVLLFLSSHQTIHTDSDCCARALLTVLRVMVLLLLVLLFLLSSRI